MLKCNYKSDKVLIRKRDRREMKAIKTTICLGIAIAILSSIFAITSCTSETETVTTTTASMTNTTTPPVTNKTTIPQLSFFEVEITEDGLFPYILTIPIGSVVTWSNICTDSRQIVSKMPLTMNSDDLRPYQSWSFTFTRLGIFKYSEIMGSTMGASDGTIIVK